MKTDFISLKWMSIDKKYMSNIFSKKKKKIFIGMKFINSSKLMCVQYIYYYKYETDIAIIIIISVKYLNIDYS